MAEGRGRGLVISCGTALTVERIDSEGVWEGGAIAAGLGLTARALNQGTAQVPHLDADPGGWHMVGVEDADADEIENSPFAAWGRTSEVAVKAGVFWGTVGAARELIARQGVTGWRIWTGGDAVLLADAVEGDGNAWVVHALVLRGLAMAAFGASARAIAQ